MPVKPKTLNWNECRWDLAREKVSMKCFQGDNMTIQLAEVRTGHSPAPHSHAYEQIVYIMQGECDFYVDGVAYQMSAGCLMSVPPNVEHYIIAKGDVPVLNLDIFYPKRDDRKESIPSCDK